MMVPSSVKSGPVLGMDKAKRRLKSFAALKSGGGGGGVGFSMTKVN
jgi:hypothetical protein